MVRLFSVLLLFTLALRPATAGSLKIATWYGGSLSCAYGSGDSGGPSRDIQIGYGRTWSFAAGADGVPTIDWLHCGNLVLRNMAITPSSEDHLIIIPDQPKRALNVLLYNYLPSAPNNNFENMQALIAEAFAAYGDPHVVLNAVITPNGSYDIYKPENYDRIFGVDGFDLVEVDTIMLPQILTYIRPWKNYDPAAFWQPANEAVKVGDSIWGVPQWLCSDFLFSRDPAVAAIRTFADLQQYLEKKPSDVPRLVGNFNGHWRFVGLYYNALADLHGFGALKNAPDVPMDQTAIDHIATLTSFCDQSGTNKCTNGFYNKQSDGTDASVFGAGEASAYVGFSEQSFYILGSNPPQAQPLFAVKVPYGTQVSPLLYVDAFVANKKTCPATSDCEGPAQAFARVINSNEVIDAITRSWDLRGSPPRRLLPASTDFWIQQAIKTDALYSQFRRLVARAKAFPNSITAQQQQHIYTDVCSALKKRSPSYAC
jgi:thiamine pyridinylase